MTKHIRALDGLRGVLAFVVMITHTHQITGHTIFWHGHLAVDFFFLLSGFVITEAYEEKLKQGTLSAERFFIVRAIRLYPMVVIGAVLAGGVSVVVMDGPANTIAMATISSLFLIPFPWFDDAGGIRDLWKIDPPLWSLFFEVLSNIAFAYFLYRLPTRWLWRLLGAAFPLLVIAAYHYGTLRLGYDESNIWGGIPRIWYGFVAGMVLNRLHHANRLPKWRVPMWLLSSIMLSVLCIPTRQCFPQIELFIVIIVFPIFLIAGLNANAEKPIWLWSGRISYPLYITHFPILRLIASFHRGLPFQDVMMALFGVICCLLTATAFLICFDEPIRKAITKRLQKRWEYRGLQAHATR